MNGCSEGFVRVSFHDISMLNNSLWHAKMSNEWGVTHTCQGVTVGARGISLRLRVKSLG